MVDGCWLDCVSYYDQFFRDEYVLYRLLQSIEFFEMFFFDSDLVNFVEGYFELFWFKDIKFDDSDIEQIVEEGDDNLVNFVSFSKCILVSSFQFIVDSDLVVFISLNVELDNVNFYIKKFFKYLYVFFYFVD